MSQRKPKSDPFFGLKYIAFCRSRLMEAPDSPDRKALLDFAKWQICKSRSVLFNDPVWERYTEEEIFIEYFAIRFDESDEMIDEFKKEAFSDNVEEISDWFEKMETKYGIKNPAPEPAKEPEEFEDTFD